MGDGCKCKRKTTWTEVATDGKFYAEKINQTITPPKPTTKPEGSIGSTKWVLGGVPVPFPLPQSYLFNDKKNVKNQYANIQSDGCINTCVESPKVVKYDPSTIEVKEIDNTFTACYSKARWIYPDPLLYTTIENVVIKATYKVKIKYTTTKYYLSHVHLCGGSCPECNNLKDRDETEQLEKLAKLTIPNQGDC
jgi:hypothetical protein